MSQILHLDIASILADHSIPWERFNHTTFFVTGATGTLGSLIVRTLLAYGKQADHEIRICVLARDPERMKASCGADYRYLNVLTGDVRDPLALDEPVDYIIHCAGVTASQYMVSHPVETLATSIRGMENILELAKAKQAKGVLYLSSMEVYGATAPEQNPITEDKQGYIDLRSPRSSYPEGKRVCELLCNAYWTEYGVPVKIVRLAQVFGPGLPLTDRRVAVQFASSVIHGKDIVLHTAGKSMSNFCYTTDAVRGMFTVLANGENGQAYNVCNDGESRTIQEIAALVADTVAEGKIRVVFDIPPDSRFGYAADTAARLCSDKLRLLGWRPCVGMEEAYRRLIRYLKESGAPAR